MCNEHVMSAKSVLRKQLNNVINSLSRKEILRQSEIVTYKVINNEVFQRAKVISVYLSMDQEIQTDTIVKEIFKRKKECYIPRFQNNNPVMEMIHLSSLDQYNKLPKNKWNIKQPLVDENLESVFERGQLDLVLVPGLGFTKTGLRLGRGKGYYDNFLNKCKNELPEFPYTIGLAFNEQIVSKIPTEAHDFKLDLIFASDLN